MGLNKSSVVSVVGPVSVSDLFVCSLQPFSGDQMDDFGSELFNSFFDDHLLERPLLAERSPPPLDMDSSPGDVSRPSGPSQPRGLRHCRLRRSKVRRSKVRGSKVRRSAVPLASWLSGHVVGVFTPSQRLRPLLPWSPQQETSGRHEVF